MTVSAAAVSANRACQRPYSSRCCAAVGLARTEIEKPNSNPARHHPARPVAAMSRVPAAGSLVEPRLDLFAQQLQCAYYPGVRNLTAAIQFGEDAVEPDFLLHLFQPRGEAVGGAADHLGGERIVEGQRLKPL